MACDVKEVMSELFPNQKIPETSEIYEAVDSLVFIGEQYKNIRSEYLFSARIDSDIVGEKIRGYDKNMTEQELYDAADKTTKKAADNDNNLWAGSAIGDVVVDTSYKTWDKMRKAHESGDGIYVMRTKSDLNGPDIDLTADKHFGNPYGIVGKGTTASKANSAKDAEEASGLYALWLAGQIDQDLEPERRQWILEQLASGKLSGKKLIYYTDKNTISHADVLASILNDENNKNAIEEENNLIEKSRTSNDEYTLHSGGALGADTLFGKAAELRNWISNHYYINQKKHESGNKKPNGANTPLSRKEFLEAVDPASQAEIDMGHIQDGYTTRNKLKLRNWNQVKYADVVYAISEFIDPPGKKVKSSSGNEYETKNTQVRGGTGGAVQMSANLGKPTYVYNLNGNENPNEGEFPRGWYEVTGEGEDVVFTKLDKAPEFKSKNFAGVGTRVASNPEYKDASNKAINELFDQVKKVDESSEPEVDTGTVVSHSGKSLDFGKTTTDNDTSTIDEIFKSNSEFSEKNNPKDALNGIEKEQTESETVVSKPKKKGNKKEYHPLDVNSWTGGPFYIGKKKFNSIMDAYTASKSSKKSNAEKKKLMKGIIVKKYNKKTKSGEKNNFAKAIDASGGNIKYDAFNPTWNKMITDIYKEVYEYNNKDKKSESGSTKADSNSLDINARSSDPVALQLSNFGSTPMEYVATNGETYYTQTAEAAYQIEKAIHIGIPESTINKILGLKINEDGKYDAAALSFVLDKINPGSKVKYDVYPGYAAKLIGNELNKKMTKEQGESWANKQNAIMDRVLESKFSQGDNMKVLLSTGDKKLTHEPIKGKENAPIDNHFIQKLQNIRDGKFDDIQEKKTADKFSVPEVVTSIKPNQIFVFGANEKGIHGAGSAKAANTKFGAKYGETDGPTGQSYAIVTKKTPSEKYTTKDEVEKSIAKFVKYASENPDKEFIVTPVGTGYAGFIDEEIFDIFEYNGALELDNIKLPSRWSKINTSKNEVDPSLLNDDVNEISSEESSNAIEELKKLVEKNKKNCE